MAFCTKCGARLEAAGRFCVSCGQPAAVVQFAGNQVVCANGATMDSKLIRVYHVPEGVRKQAYKYSVLELYVDRLVGKGGKNGDITYFFKNYMTITWTPASIASQFAQIVFVTHENASRYITASNLVDLADLNKIPFCSGMFSYAEANNYTKALYMDIKAAMDAFKEHESDASTNAPVVQASFSPADELRKFKELLDLGIITQEEFEAKKRQLLGL